MVPKTHCCYLQRAVDDATDEDGVGAKQQRNSFPSSVAMATIGYRAAAAAAAVTAAACIRRKRIL